MHSTGSEPRGCSSAWSAELPPLAAPEIRPASTSYPSGNILGRNSTGTAKKAIFKRYWVLLSLIPHIISSSTE